MLTDILEIFQINRPIGTDREVNLKVCENIVSILSLYGHIKIACMLLVLFSFDKFALFAYFKSNRSQKVSFPIGISISGWSVDHITSHWSQS